MDRANEAVPPCGKGLTCQVCGGMDIHSYTTDPAGDFVRCRRCGLIFNTRQFDPDELIDDHYDEPEYFARYERLRRIKVWGDGRKLDAVLGYVRGNDYLDIGCGIGSSLEAAAQRGLDAVGIDLGQYPVSYCRQRGLSVQLGSLTDTGLDNASFDLVTAWSVLEHIPDTDDGLREVRRILRPGGIFAFIIPNGEYLKAHLLRGSYHYYHGHCAQVHYTYHNLRTIQTVMRRTGFQPLRYPWLITRRLRTPLGALGELAAFPPRSLGRQLRHACHMVKDPLLIGRAV